MSLPATISRQGQRGSVIILIAVFSTLLCACVAMSLDCGRLYIVRGEAQVYVDSSALAAARCLNGSSIGLRAAEAAVRSNPNRYNFNTETFRDTVVSFAEVPKGPFSPSPRRPEGCRYVRVTAQAPVQMLLLPALTGQKSSVVTATAVAVQGTTPTPVTLVQ